MHGKSASISIDRQIGAIADGQEGMVSLTQLQTLGLGRGAIEHRVRTGRLYPRHQGVFAVGHVRGTTGSERWAALLACGENAVLSHRTAADVWDLRPSNPRIVDVTIESRAGRKPRRGIRLHRAPLPDDEVDRGNDLPVTTVARTLLDLGAVLTLRALERTIDEAERLDLFDLEAVDAVLESNRGRSGRPRLTAVLVRHRPGSTATRSPLEERFLALCRKHGLPQPEVNVPIGPYTADFLWREQRLIVETDGRDTHARLAAFESDRKRDAYLMVKGFRVVRYTDRRIAREGPKVVQELRVLLELG